MNNEGSFDITLNENCCDFASGMAQAVLIIVGTFFDGLFPGIHGPETTGLGPSGSDRPRTKKI